MSGSQAIMILRFIIITVCLGLSTGFILIDDSVVQRPLFNFHGSQDEILPADGHSRLVHLPMNFTYFGRKYSQFYISKDGYIAFTSNRSDVTFHEQDWSSTDVTPIIDIPFIAPYYHQGQGLGVPTRYTGRVQFQEITDAGPGMHDLTELGAYVRTQIIGSNGFDPDWAMQITWNDVTSAKLIASGACSGVAGNPCPTNTFQVILLADKQNSYAIFNYGQMNVPAEPFDQAGFNVGSHRDGAGSGWMSVLPHSGNMNQLSMSHGSDRMGRYIFRVSSRTLARGGCTVGTSNGLLDVYPNYAGMFGGKMLDIAGPCFSSRDSILCRFGDTASPGVYVSPVRARCMVPRLLFRDRVPLSVSTDGGVTFPYSTNVTIVLPARMPSSQHVQLKYSGSNTGWYGNTSRIVTVVWKPALLSSYPRDTVTISLIGYREFNGKGQFHRLARLGSAPVTSGQVALNTADIQCNGPECFQYEIGLVEVCLDNATSLLYRYMSSRTVPLGPFVQTAMTSRYGSDWPTAMCTTWFNKDKKDLAWLQPLLSCPCSLQQSLVDFGRWQPDGGCNIMDAGKGGNCYYHTGAVHCVRAVQPVDGAGNQCCYGPGGELRFAQDTFGGSTPDRSHDWGAAPYTRPGLVPSLSHWITDVVTFYYCCLWNGYKSCDYYMDERPTKDCTGYTPPVPASVYGLGHVTTFGGATMRILNEVDYILLSMGNTTLQCRFSRNPFFNHDSSMYSLTSVSIQEAGVSDRVELRLRDPVYSTDTQRIDVYINGEYIDFDYGAMAWQDFTGVAVANTDRDGNVFSNFTVMMTNGIGFQLAERANTLQLDVLVPTNQAVSVSGLLGDLSGTLRARGGSQVNMDSNTAPYIASQYQLSWSVPSSENLFIDELTSHNSVTPLGPLAATNITDYNTMCHGIVACEFDYNYTGSVDLASSTREAVERYTSLRASLQPVRSCGLIDVPRVTKDNYNYVIGTTTHLTGCRSGSLSGQTTYRCVKLSNTTQSWFPAVTATCSAKQLR